MGRVAVLGLVEPKDLSDDNELTIPVLHRTSEDMDGEAVEDHVRNRCHKWTIVTSSRVAARRFIISI
jgi:hypothetical protein